MRAIAKLLIANRGEIACRVMRTASAMGIRTVAVFADGDADAPFVAAADEAIALGGRTAAETYLDVGKILDAARRTGADAVHPGYGFLSENAAFAQAVIDEGLVWVGPPPNVIASMGDKLTAKRLMADAGVPVLPSVELDEGADLEVAGATVGFPALVKASAGGGGKGMRIVESPDELAAAVAGARREAAAAFGDPTVFLERYVTPSRHVEIQILGDSHGNLVHCFERECSIQRRHQKIIEESPSPAVDEELRDRMGAAAVAAAKAIRYENAGTVEFLLGPDGEFAFLEVNTRLQVEHPVTEAVTGLDLVREQLLVAQGQRLGFAQTDLSLSGSAIEARLYAEDPDNGFLPATGTVLAWQAPADPPVRFDSGVQAGSVVGVEFDPMLAKVIAHAPTRLEAAARLALALERLRLHGVVTNRDFLVASLRHPEFLAGNTTTDFIDRVQPSRRFVPSDDDVRTAAVIAALAAQHGRRREAGVLATFPSGWRNSHMPPERARYRAEGSEVLVEYRARRDGGFDIVGDGSPLVAYVRGVDGNRFDVDIERRRLPATVSRHGDRWWVRLPSGDVQLQELPRFPEPEVEAVAGGLVAPMPGKIISVDVAVGDEVTEGALLVILEAMKMEHRVVAPFAGTVVEVRVAEGDGVSNGDLLVVVDAGEEGEAA